MLDTCEKHQENFALWKMIEDSKENIMNVTSDPEIQCWQNLSWKQNKLLWKLISGLFLWDTIWKPL